MRGLKVTIGLRARIWCSSSSESFGLALRADMLQRDVRGACVLRERCGNLRSVPEVRSGATTCLLRAQAGTARVATSTSVSWRYSTITAARRPGPTRTVRKNGVAEQGHRRLKDAVAGVVLRGSSDFGRWSSAKFVRSIVDGVTGWSGRSWRVSTRMRALPAAPVRSTCQTPGCSSGAPSVSRTYSRAVAADRRDVDVLYADHVEVLQGAPESMSGYAVRARHA